MTNMEKVAYIRGLAEGLELDQSQKEVKVLNAIIDLLDDMAFSLSEVEDTCDEIQDQLDAVDEDLGSLEDDFYGDEDEDGCGCDFDDEEYYEVTCPSCGETICLSNDIIEDGRMDCPNCGENLEFDFEEDEDDDCDCGCCHHD